VSVVVGRPYYRPYYRPYFYRPFYNPILYGAYYRPYFYTPFYWYPYSAVAYGYPGYDADGSLRVQVSPNDTEIYIDNYFAGTADDFDGMFQRLHVEPGAHDITLYHDGFRTVRQRVYIQRTGTFRLRYMMVPLAPGEAPEPRPAEPPPPPQGAPGQSSQTAPYPYPPQQGGPNRYPPQGAQGPPPGAYPPQGAYPPPDQYPQQPGERSSSLSIRVQPADAEVMIDGERWDGSPTGERLVVQVAPGVHHVEVRRDGYRTYQSDITVRPGDTSNVNISLTRQP